MNGALIKKFQSSFELMGYITLEKAMKHARKEVCFKALSSLWVI